MLTYVVNLDHQFERWEACSAALRNVGARPVRWPAIPAESVAEHELLEWHGLKPVNDQRRRVAIARTYAALMEHLGGQPSFEWAVFQDDVIATKPIDVTGPRSVHLYAGWMVRYGDEMRKVDPSVAPHVHPRAFRIRRAALVPLLDCWSDETRPICESWTRYLNPTNVSWDTKARVIE